MIDVEKKRRQGREAQARYRERHPEKIAARERARVRPPQQTQKYRLRRKYGLTLAAIEAMIVGQGGCCALCREPLKTPSLSAFVHVDHCHETGRVRGILCRDCNTSLGKLGDNETSLLRALAYVRGNGTP